MFKLASTTQTKSNTHCGLCGKGRIRGNFVSHSKQRTKRVFKPNLQAYWVMEGSKRVRRMFCVKCLRKIKSQYKYKSKSELATSSSSVSPIAP